MKILAIETSCDETAAALYDSNRGLIMHHLYSQASLHQRFGGVVPELASRVHVEYMGNIVKATLDDAATDLSDVDAIAVTNRPGLPGSLFVGVAFAKALAYAGNKKILGINHLEGHVFSSFLEHNVPFPHLCLTSSGGHTSLYLVHDFGEYEVVGTTHDDAAGEAFDKVAKLLNLGYPGGPVIEKLAKEVMFQDFFHYPRSKQKDLNFSFSGVKTAVLYDLVKRGAYDLAAKKLLNHSQEFAQQVASSFLVCIADIFLEKLTRALTLYPDVRAITFVGGVACNRYISERIQQLATKNNISFFKPSPKFCTDNAAMIAFVGHYKALNGEFDDLLLDIATQ